MLNFNRRDPVADPADNANTVLKPAIYEPPGSANALMSLALTHLKR